MIAFAAVVMTVFTYLIISAPEKARLNNVDDGMRPK
jgi:hypothetical protein